MSDLDLILELEPDAGGTGRRGFVSADDADWLKERARREPGSTRVRLMPNEGDTEGHAAGDALAVSVIATTDDDDTEGHAISVHFPTRDEADAFRRRLLLAGVLAGTVALGAAGGMALSSLPSDAPAEAGAAAAVAQPANPDSDIGIMDASGAGAAAAVAQPANPDSDIGIMDASGAGAASTNTDDEPSDPVVGPR